MLQQKIMQACSLLLMFIVLNALFPLWETKREVLQQENSFRYCTGEPRDKAYKEKFPYQY